MNRDQDPILRTVVAGTLLLVNVFALYLLLRGHHAPGGGFIAGLASCISLVLFLLAFGVDRTHRALRIEPVNLAVTGVALAAGSATAPMLAGRPFLEQINTHVTLPLLGRIPLGTPMVFDTGVFLLVVGIGVKLIFTLAQSTQGRRALVRAEELRFAAPTEVPIEEAVPAGREAAAETLPADVPAGSPEEAAGETPENT
jgi:multicomponent Na+:H+ antiporter subunit B